MVQGDGRVAEGGGESECLDELVRGHGGGPEDVEIVEHFDGERFLCYDGESSIVDGGVLSQGIESSDD